jgi:hypothetical protein
MGDSTRDSGKRLQVTAHSQVAPRRAGDASGNGLMRLQRDAGNAAVAQLLGGTAVVAREGSAGGGAKVAHVSGKQVDGYLIANTVLKPYIQSKMQSGMKAENAVKTENADEFKKAWVVYAMRSENPQTGKNFTQAEAEAWEHKVNAFLDGDTVHVHEGRGDAGTTLHESMHFYSEAAFRDGVGYNFNEGATEYFTHLVADAHHIDRAYAFSRQMFAVNRVVRNSSEQKLAEAYFKNDLTGLEADIDKKWGEGTWKSWLGLMAGDKLQEAGELFREKPKPAVKK